MYIYFLNKIFISLILTTKLEPDYFLDLRGNFEEVQTEISKNKSLEQLTLQNGLFLSWLEPDNIPEQIDLIFKQLKSEGLLR